MLERRLVTAYEQRINRREESALPERGTGFIRRLSRKPNEQIESTIKYCKKKIKYVAMEIKSITSNLLRCDMKRGPDV
jgi:hypothetical protein